MKVSGRLERRAEQGVEDRHQAPVSLVKEAETGRIPSTRPSPSLALPAPPSTPAFGSKPSLTLRWALSQALPRRYSDQLTPSAALGPPAQAPVYVETPTGRSCDGVCAGAPKDRPFPAVAGV